MKTVATNADVGELLDSTEDPVRREDCKRVLRLMRRVTGEPPVVWGDNIVGFGTYRYRRANGKEYEFFRTGFSSRKSALTLYILPGYEDHSKILARLGPHRSSKSCLYLKRLADIDMAVLEELIETGYEDMRRLYPDKAGPAR